MLGPRGFFEVLVYVSVVATSALEVDNYSLGS